jgi:hypothetical protein
MQIELSDYERLQLTLAVQQQVVAGQMLLNRLNPQPVPPPQPDPTT